MYSNGTDEARLVTIDGILCWQLAGKTFPVMAGGDGGDGGTGAPAPEAAPAPPADDSGSDQSGTKSQPAPAKDRGTSPWAKDLADRGLDDPRFDEYLRTSWQPRMTQHEQAIAKYTQLFGDPETADIASRILHGLNTDAGATVKELVQLLELNPQELFALQQAQQAAQPGQPETPAQPEAQTPPDPRMEWIEQQMQAQRQTQEDQQWQQHLAEVTERVPGFDTQLYTHLVIANQGDTNAAFRDYQEYHNRFGLTPKPGDTEVPTLGDAPGITPREANNPGSIKDAVKQFMAEDRAARQR